MKKLIKNYLIKIILFLIILIFNYNMDSSVFMESFEKEKLENSSSIESWTDWFLKNKIKILTVIGVSLFIIIGTYSTTNIEFLLQDLNTTACTNLCDQIKNIIYNIENNSEIKVTEIKIKMLESFIKNYKNDKIRVVNPEKFEETIKKIIEEIKKN